MDAETILVGRYRLIRPLGEGGVAEVWLAEDQQLQREVALKLLRPQYSRDRALLERFRREAKSVASLGSPNIVQIYDVHLTEPPPFLVMEYVDGGDLRDLLSREGSLPLARALAMLREIAIGVAAAHAAGLVHRDLKPANILLTARREVKVSDFGIARDMAHAGMTEPGTVWGTSHYLAPEQALGRAVSPASDCYALGVLLFEMLAGRVPFQGGDPVAVALAHVQEPPPDIRQFAPATPPWVAELIEQLLAKAPERRPPDARALLDILDGYQSRVREATILGAKAATAAPTSRAAAAPRHEAPRRSPLGPLLALILLAALVGGGLWAFNRLDGRPLAAEAATPEPPPVPTFTPEPGVPTPEPPTPEPPTPTVVPPTQTPPIVISGPRQGNGPDAVALYVGGGPAIEVDGSLREWGAPSVEVNNVTYIPEGWQGTRDLSGRAQFAWDERYLYLAVTRVDALHVQPYEGFELYRGDAVELWIDADLRGDFNVAEANGDDYQFAFSPGDFESLRAEGVVYQPGDRDPARNAQIRVMAEAQSDGYTLEARIPWSLMGVTPGAGTVFGYALVLSDNDTPDSGPDYEPMQVTTTTESPFRKPLTFGNLILRD